MLAAGVPALSLTGEWISRRGRPQPIELAEEEDGANLAAMTSRASSSRPSTANAPYNARVTTVRAARVEQHHANELLEELQTEVLELKDERDSMLRALRQRTEEQKRMERDVRMQKLIFHAKTHEKQMSCDELAHKLVEAKKAVAAYGATASDKHEAFDNFRQRLTQILSLGCSTKWTPTTQISVSEEVHGDPSAGMEERVAFVTLSDPAAHTACPAVAVMSDPDEVNDALLRDNSFEVAEMQEEKTTLQTQASQLSRDHSSTPAAQEPPEDHAAEGDSCQGLITLTNALLSSSAGSSRTQSQAHSQRSEHALCTAVVGPPCVEFDQLSAMEGQDVIDCCSGVPEPGSDHVQETVGQAQLVVLPNGTSTAASAASVGQVDDFSARKAFSAKDPFQHVPETVTTSGSREAPEGEGHGVPETISAEALSMEDRLPAANLEASTKAAPLTECSQAANAPGETSSLMAPSSACLDSSFATAVATLTLSTASTSATPPGQIHSQDLPEKLQAMQTSSQSHRAHGCPEDASALIQPVLAPACGVAVNEKHMLDCTVSNLQADTKCQDSEEDECSSSEEETQSDEDSSSDSDDFGSLAASPEASTIATGREICHSTGSKMPSDLSSKEERPPLSETALWRASVFRKALAPLSSPLADRHSGDPSMSLAAVLAPPFEVASQDGVERTSVVRSEGSQTSCASQSRSVTSLKEFTRTQRQRFLQDESRACFPCDDASSQRTSAPSCSSRNTRGSARSRAVSEVPFMPQQRVRLPADSLRAHAQDIVQSRLRELEEPQPPPPRGPPPTQGERLGRTATPLPPSYAMLGAKLPPPAVVRATPSKAYIGSGKELAGRRTGESRMNSLSGIYGRLGNDPRPMLRVQSLPVLRVASRRSLGPASRPLDGRMCGMAVR